MDTKCRSWNEAEIHIESLSIRLRSLEEQLRHVQKQLDTLGSPWWKRVWFRLNGWPPWWVVGEKKPRPWDKHGD